jgi:hypothetical protein
MGVAKGEPHSRVSQDKFGKTVNAAGRECSSYMFHPVVFGARRFILHDAAMCFGGRLAVGL